MSRSQGLRLGEEELMESVTISAVEGYDSNTPIDTVRMSGGRMIEHPPPTKKTKQNNVVLNLL
jgi:hypothetical protein